MLEHKIDALIGAGWRVLETNFDEDSFQEWRKQALDCVVALCGESHPYIEYFESGVQKARTSSVLTGVGLLTAAQIGEGKTDQLKGGIKSPIRGVAVQQVSSEGDGGSPGLEVGNSRGASRYVSKK